MDNTKLILERLSQLEDKIDKIDDKARSIEVISAEHKVILDNQYVSLNDHIRRTELLEEFSRKFFRHIHWVEGVVKFIGLSGIVVGIVVGIIKVAG